MSVYNVQRYPAEYFIDQICNGDCGEGGGGGASQLYWETSCIISGLITTGMCRGKVNFDWVILLIFA